MFNYQLKGGHLDLTKNAITVNESLLYAPSINTLDFKVKSNNVSSKT